MANETVEVVSEPIEGLVAAIVSERELAINIGSDHGVIRGMKFKVLTGSPTEITDPVTGKTLGTISRTKVSVRAVSVEPEFSLCETYRTYHTGGSTLSAVSQWLQPPRTVHETLRAEDADYVKDLPENESFVKKGDRVQQILEGSLITIQELENVLNNAVLRGVLSKTFVQETVEEWKQAEAALEAAKHATEHRDQKLETALEQYNSATSDITRLYGKAQPSEEDE